MAGSSNIPFFPSHDINPKQKDGKWMTQMVQAIWTQFQNQSIKSFNKGVMRYNLNRLYAAGKQPTDIYKPMFELSEDDNTSFMNLDYSPPSIIPKYKRIILNKFAKMTENFTVSVSAIDKESLNDQAAKEAEQFAKIQVRKMLDELNMPSVMKKDPIDPEDEEELQMQADFGYKHDEAVQIEKDIDTVFTHERLKDKLQVIRDYGFDTGVWGVKAYTDTSTGKVGFRVVDPNNLIPSPTTDPKFGDIWYCGEYILMTIDAVRKEAQKEMKRGEITEDQLMSIARKNAGQNFNPTFYGATAPGVAAYDYAKIPVMDIEFLSKNKQFYESRKDEKTGNIIQGETYTPNKKNRLDAEEDKVVVYRAKWIIGTEIVFNYGYKSDIYRKPSSYWDTRLSYILCAPEMRSLETMPFIENMIPYVDQITLAWYKLQNVIARARPKGIAIEIGALEDISLGDGAMGNMKPINILNMFNQTGSLVYRRLNLEGTASNYKPIEELGNGLGTEASEYFNVIRSHIAMLNSMIGFNELTDGSTPDPKTLNGVANMAMENTNNAIHHLMLAERYIVERLADEIAVRVYNSKTYKKSSPYRVSTGDTATPPIGNDGSIDREFSIVIDWENNQLDKQKLDARVQQSMANKEITLADVIAIENIRNTKQAELLLAYRIKKNQERQMQMSQQNAMVQAQASAVAAKVAEEEKRKTLAMQLELEEKVKTADAQRAAALMQLEYGLKGVLEGNKGEVKKEIESLAGVFSERVERIKAEANLIAKKEKVENPK
jgi:hypothetical protein